MSTPHDQTMPPTLDPEGIYAVCLERVQALERGAPAASSSLDTVTLAWSLAVSVSHATEITTRVFSVLFPSDPRRVSKLASDFVMSDTPASLYALWHVWFELHADWGSDDSLDVPVYFLFCQRHRTQCQRELGRRGRTLHLPVLKGLAGLTAGPMQPDKFRLQRFLTAMDTTLEHTVRRSLGRNPDEEALAIEGAMARKRRGEENIVAVLRRGGTIQMDSGQSFEVPSIPTLSVPGMEDPDGLNGLWRIAANNLAFELFASLAPGFSGDYETILSDAAHAAQRVEREQADTKRRGGTGGPKAEKAGTAEPAAQHIPIGKPEEGNPDMGWVYIDPAGDRPNPEQEVGAKEEAECAFRIAIDRWGESGQRMLEARMEGKTDKEAAKDAGISAPALTKRLKTLRKLIRPLN